MVSEIQDVRRDLTTPEVFTMHELGLRQNKLIEELRRATAIANLFAGNLNETRFWLRKLQELGNTTVKFTTVDKFTPDNPLTVDNINEQYQGRVSFIEDDVFHYLMGESANSLDLVTAYGAEYVWRSSTEKAQELCALVAKVLKPGGIAIIPALPEGAEEGSPLKKQRFPGIYVKE